MDELSTHLHNSIGDYGHPICWGIELCRRPSSCEFAIRERQTKDKMMNLK